MKTPRRPPLQHAPWKHAPLLLLAVVLAACGSAHRSAPAAASSTSSGAPTSATSAGSGPTTTGTTGPTATTARAQGVTGGSTTSTPKTAPPLTLTDTDNHRTVTVHRGTEVDVVLHSTYWTYPPGPTGNVLTSLGQPAYAPDPLTRCVPGGGCGTATARYLAANLGSATVTASRTSCGEAMGCTGGRGAFDVTVTVVA
jgi:hypothetical protein